MPGAVAAVASIIGATNWGGCYQSPNSNLPVIIDGAQVIFNDLGSRIIKLNAGSPATSYPWNSPAWPQYFDSLTSLLSHQYYQTVFAMDWDSVDLVAYSQTGDNRDENYWRDGFSPSDAQRETSQFQAATELLLQRYPNITFVFQHWEGDWSVRGGYDPTTPPSPQAIANMISWLSARQAGVSAGRANVMAQRRAAGISPAQATGNVFHASEVNLVAESMQSGFPNVVNSVLPYVKPGLDMVSYSSYDTQQSSSGPITLEGAIRFIAKNAARTPESPAQFIQIGEYGAPLNEWPVAQVQSMVTNVLNVTLNTAADLVARSYWWETFSNEASATAPKGTCVSQPARNPQDVRGFWLQLPDGSKSFVFDMLRAAIVNGTI